METLLSRYRSLVTLVLVIFVQVLMVGYQVRAGGDMRLIRVWAVTLVTPFAKAIESVRAGVGGFLQHYLFLQNAAEENRELKRRLEQLQLENQQLQAQLEELRQLEKLKEFASSSPQKLLVARVIGTGTEVDTHTVFIDRGSRDGVRRGMAVILAEGIVGKVVAAYLTASQVLLATAPSFAVGVVTGRHHVYGVLKGTGAYLCQLEYIPSEQEIDEGEPVYTSGLDRVFPRGLPVGWVKSVEPDGLFLKVTVELAALQAPLEYVLVVLKGVHQPLPPPGEPLNPELSLLEPPPPEVTDRPLVEELAGGVLTDADRLLRVYEEIGRLQGHTYGEG